MTIKASDHVKKHDEIQTELQVQSREDRLAQLFETDAQILELQSEMERYKAVVAGYREQIKEREEDRARIVGALKVGQETLVITEATEEEPDAE